ncbi:hypothetical protein ASPZODRAFT_129782 [Penicilliopsis zonata CBS 506.65]|uniref:Uncharacterized protein n=1 Tax=Penicilliopsis zonata CBS 506.65 TaxID=1073090 RepID=A0A1L9SQ32_9EURO|nr:hypothetical protein ASPZODRAFT_129782 [Penicilliopsis zonata CBS 506.65]OJJ49345.1 hypothetical protein ASPZODRAFT_129782 [Penicilliopsis zonata CBS 506.65]
MPHSIGNDRNSAPRPTGSAGYASVDAVASIGDLNSSERRLGTGTGGTVTAPGYSAGQNADLLENAESERALSKEEADRLYEERMEEEYAKREGGA